jgi:hypothetical protein
MNIFDLISGYKSELTIIALTAIITTAVITLVVGRNKLKWIVWEFIKMYSGEKSWLSKKRVESGIAFSFAFWMTAYYLRRNIDGMDIWSFGYVLTVWLFIAGYTVSQIQSEKKINVG